MLVVSFGISARSGTQAVVEARAEGKKVNFLELLTLWPYPEKAVIKAAGGVKRFLVSELNRGQVVRDVERILDKKIEVVPINKTNGTIFTPEEITAFF